jgi:uncharacterized protein YkvS
MKTATIPVVFLGLVTLCACDVVDPARPTAQPDVEVFGNLLDVERSPEDPGSWIVRIQIGAPRAIRAADEETGKPTPEIEKGMIATVTVDGDAVVFVDDRPGLLEEIPSGTEVVALPIAGSTAMHGSNDLRLDANTVMDFESYRRWRLPKLTSEADVEEGDPARINSAGAELAPVPVGTGIVLYFSAHLRPPATPDDSWHGAIRDGLDVPEEGAGAVEQSYRSQLTANGWTTPELVRIPGLDEARQVRVTWVNDDETVALLTVTDSQAAVWVGRSTRSGAKSRWSEPERLEVLGQNAHDAVYLTGSTTKIVFASYPSGGSQSDLFLYDPKSGGAPAPLQPPIFSTVNEWNPRTGPEGELLFNRGDRQLILKGGEVRPLRLPGPHRVPLTQAATTNDGAWLFFCLPKYRTPEMDSDIFVAPVKGDFELGPPVPADEWRP